MSFAASVRSVAPWFAIVALVLVMAVMVLRRSGYFSDAVILHQGPAALAGANPEEGRKLKIITLLPKDGIAAIFDPTFVNAEDASSQLAPDALVIGSSHGGQHPSHGAAFLRTHDVANDTPAGPPTGATGPPRAAGRSRREETS